MTSSQPNHFDGFTPVQVDVQQPHAAHAAHAASQDAVNDSEKGVVSSDSSEEDLAHLAAAKEAQRRGVTAVGDGDGDGDADAAAASTNPVLRHMDNLSRLLARFHIESVSVAPIPRHQRTDRRWWSVALLWFSANFNLLSFSTGTLVFDFELGTAGAFCTIIFFSLFSSFFPAYFLTFGPKLGLRQMIHTRFSWGWFAPLIALLNAATLCGYTILNCILGGETLSAVSDDGSLTPTVGIVIVAVVSLAVSFAGIRVLHLFERWLWAPTFVCFCILIGLAGTGSEGLHFPTGDTAPKTTSFGVLGMASTVLGFLVSWAGLGSDVSLYLGPDFTPTWSLFWSAFAAFSLGSTPLFLLGASFALSAADNDAWAAALGESNGALLNLVMTPKVGNFGKFVTVMLGLSIIANTAASIYSFGLSLPAILPPLRRLPRFIFPLIIMAIVIPLSIVGAHAFYNTLTSFTSVLAYWSALFVAVVLVDHVVIRRCDFGTYDATKWDRWRELPVGLAAIGSAVLSLGLLVPCISQTWFTGPIAAHVGDLGFEVGFVLCMVLYAPLRLLEKRVIGR